jgi:hypothetical protein
VALSTTEAEFVSDVAAGKEICWMPQLLEEIGYTAQAPSTLFIDNQSAMSVAKNPEHQKNEAFAFGILLVEGQGGRTKDSSDTHAYRGDACRFVN